MFLKILASKYPFSGSSTLTIDTIYLSSDFAYYWLSEILTANKELVLSLKKYNRVYVTAETVKAQKLFSNEKQ